jgi:hypothetical protein
VSDGNGLQGEPIGQKAGEQVRARLPLQLHGRNEARRHPRLPLRLCQEHEVVTLKQLDLEGQDLGRGHGAAHNSMPLLVRQYGPTTGVGD